MSASRDFELEYTVSKISCRILISFKDNKNIEAPGTNSEDVLPLESIVLYSWSVPSGSSTSHVRDVVGGRPYIDASSLNDVNSAT